MKKSYKILALTLLVFSTSSSVLATDIPTGENTILFEKYNIVGGENSTYITSGFVTPRDNANDVNINYVNHSPNTARVELYKQGLFKDKLVQSFSVNGNDKQYQTYSVKANTAYYIKIIDNVSNIKGELRAIQID
ncbi:MAG: hypothetical protein ATN35_11875 [Epulopiscium sp. Nele67-Bin004]|nr:MAG: hypothetical protein ATN35_11875 [Epulopiscium sp. Nele67-Bin004]